MWADIRRARVPGEYDRHQKERYAEGDYHKYAVVELHGRRIVNRIRHHGTTMPYSWGISLPFINGNVL